MQGSGQVHGLGGCALRDTHFGEILHLAGNNTLTVALLTGVSIQTPMTSNMLQSRTITQQNLRGEGHLLTTTMGSSSAHCSSDPRFLHSLQH